MIDMPEQFPEDLLYSDTHEWVRENGGEATIGLTDYAQSQLGDIVHMDVPKIGSEFKKGDSIGVVESVKTVADIYSPITGQSDGCKYCPQGSSPIR
jgi:glycine cleavage system H protein